MSSLYNDIRVSSLPLSTQVIVPHFAVPFQFKITPAGVSVPVHEQGTFEEIRDCVATIVRYTRGSRPESPEFGITPLEFTTGVDFPMLMQEIVDDEPRADMLVTSSIDPLDESIERVVIGIVESAVGTTARGQTGGSSNV